MANGRYAPPIRDRTLVTERTDQGKDFGGFGPIYSIGDGIVRQVSSNSGWPGGGWVSITLTDGPRKGWTFFVAEYIVPNVRPGQRVTADTVIANQHSGIEMGWVASPTQGNPNATNALSSQLGHNAKQRGISKTDPGAVPTAEGTDFARFLQSLDSGGGGTYATAASGVQPAAAALTPEQQTAVNARSASANAPTDLGVNVYEPEVGVNDTPQLWAQIAGQVNIAPETSQLASQYVQNELTPLQQTAVAQPIPPSPGPVG